MGLGLLCSPTQGTHNIASTKRSESYEHNNFLDDAIEFSPFQHGVIGINGCAKHFSKRVGSKYYALPFTLYPWKRTAGGVLSRKEIKCPVAVTDAFRINKSANLISESDMTHGSAFFVANVNKHSNNYSNGVGIFMCMSRSVNFSDRKPLKNYCIYF